MKFKKVKFRILKTSYKFYDVQIWRIYFPFWVNLKGWNYWHSFEEAKNAINDYKNRILYEE